MDRMGCILYLIMSNIISATHATWMCHRKPKVTGPPDSKKSPMGWRYGSVIKNSYSSRRKLKLGFHASTPVAHSYLCLQ